MTDYGLDSFGSANSHGHALYTYCVLTNGEFLLICFDPVNNVPTVQLVEVVEEQLTSGWFKTVAQEDWPE